MIHISRSGGTLGVFDEARVREGLRTGEFIETDLGWTEGMTTWRPLSELESFGAQSTTAAPPAAAGSALPQSSSAPAGSGASSTTAPGSMGGGSTPAASEMSPAVQGAGLPWENRAQLGLVNALFATIGMMLTRPAEAFAAMKRDAGFGDPLLYTLIIGTAGAVVQFGFSLILPSFGALAGGEGALGGLLLGGGTSFVMLILTPILIVLMAFIVSGILHVGLMILGGAKRSYETTFRVVAYGGGSANVFQFVPVCGSMIAGITALVLYCIGLARAHETDTGRAIGAVLLPLVVCCGGGFLLIVLFGGMAAAFGR